MLFAQPRSQPPPTKKTKQNKKTAFKQLKANKSICLSQLMICNERVLSLWKRSYKGSIRLDGQHFPHGIYLQMLGMVLSHNVLFCLKKSNSKYFSMEFLTFFFQ